MNELVKKINVDGLDFQITKLPAMEAMRMEKKLMTVLAPVAMSFMNPDANGTKDMMESNIDFTKVAKVVSDVLSSLPDHEYEQIIISSLRGVVYLETGKAPEEITLPVFNRIFVGQLLSVYKVMFEVMKFNKFCFFELVGGIGSETKKTGT